MTKEMKTKTAIPIRQLETLNAKQKALLPYPEVYEKNGCAYHDTTDRNGNLQTVKLGKSITVDAIIQDIDTAKTHIILKNGKTTYKLNPSDLSPSEMLTLANYGFDANFNNRYSYYYYIENLKSIALRTFSHSQIGWGKFKGKKTIFKFDRLITKDKIIQSEYTGNFSLSSSGTAESWATGIRMLVVGHIGLEIILLTSVCAIVNGFLDEDITPIVHIYNESSVGKSTSLKVAASVAGPCVNSKTSFFNSWVGTSNSLLNLMSGNFGVLMIFDDTSSATIKDRAGFVYKLSSCRDKRRLNSNMKQVNVGEWKTLVLSSGEEPFISEKDLKGGLQVRLIELAHLPLTRDSEHADKLNEFVMENYGTAIIPIVQEMFNIGKKQIFSQFDEISKTFVTKLNKGKFNARLAKIYSLFIISASLLNKCFDLGINEENILAFFVEYHNQNKCEIDLSAKAFEYLKNTIAINAANFEIIPKYNFHHTDRIIRDLYGNIVQHSKYIEVAIVKSKCDELLEQGGFKDLNLIYKAFKDKELIKTDADSFAPKRTVGSVRVRCIVLVISYDEIPDFLTYLKKARAKKKKRLISEKLNL